MKVKKIATVTTILLFGATNFLFGDASEDAITKALAEINTVKVMKSTAPQIVSESEAMVLSADIPKEVTKKSKVKRKIKRKVRRHRRTRPVVRATSMEDLPMAKSYPMDYDVSNITE